MSIRIQSDNLSGAAAPAPGRTDEISRPASFPSPATAGPGARGADSVDISSLSQSVAAAGAAQDIQHAGRLSQLAALYRSGQYNVDAGAVSRAMVSQALNVVPGENS